MNSSNVVLLLVVVVSLALVAEATFDLTFPAFALGPVAFGGAALTAAQITGFAGVAALGKAAGLAKGLLLGSLLRRSNNGGNNNTGGGHSRRGRGRGSHRGRRSITRDIDATAVTEVETTVMTMERLASLEPEQCYQMLLCSAATGNLHNYDLEKSLAVVEDAMLLDPSSKYTQKYRQAALFGASRQDIRKCEHQYQCSVSMNMFTKIFK